MREEKEEEEEEEEEKEEEEKANAEDDRVLARKLLRDALIQPLKVISRIYRFS